jgi:hypothetical protein
VRLKIELASREAADELLQSPLGVSEVFGVLIFCALQINETGKCVSGLRNHS